MSQDPQRTLSSFQDFTQKSILLAYTFCYFSTCRLLHFYDVYCLTVLLLLEW